MISEAEFVFSQVSFAGHYTVRHNVESSCLDNGGAKVLVCSDIGAGVVDDAEIESILTEQQWNCGPNSSLAKTALNRHNNERKQT